MAYDAAIGERWRGQRWQSQPSKPNQRRCSTVRRPPSPPPISSMPTPFSNVGHRQPGSISEVGGHIHMVRSAPNNGHRATTAPCPFRADIVAKVENRATRKISRKLIFGFLRRCVAFQRHYGGPWSILDEVIWSLTSPLVKRVSGSKKFRSSPQKDFCNNICHVRT